MPEGQVLEFTHVTKRFNEVTAVSDFSARVEPGAVTAFLGPNGAGKTTTLRILLGQVRATSGTATIGGTAYGELRQPLRTIGAVLEETAYRPRRTAERQLTIAAKANGVPLARVGEVLSLVGLDGEGDSRIGGFSLGMRQRLSVAHALLGDPGALVFDEPANGLDPEGIRWMRLLMRRLADEGRTVLVSSHVLSEVEQVADNVLVLSKGELVLASGIETLADPKGGSVIVDAADRDALSAALSAAGFDIEVLRSGLTVRGGDAGTVGAVAADAGIALSTLVQRGPTLEDVFIDLMRGGRHAPPAYPAQVPAPAPIAPAVAAEALAADATLAPNESVVAIPVAAAAAWAAEAAAAPADEAVADDLAAAGTARADGDSEEEAGDEPPTDDSAEEVPAEEAPADDAENAAPVEAADDTDGASADEAAADEATGDEATGDESESESESETTAPPARSFDEILFGAAAPVAADAPTSTDEARHSVAEIFDASDDEHTADDASEQQPADVEATADGAAGAPEATDDVSTGDSPSDDEGTPLGEDASEVEHTGVEIFADLAGASDADHDGAEDDTADRDDSDHDDSEHDDSEHDDSDGSDTDEDPRSAAVSSMLAAAARAYYEDEPKDYPLSPESADDASTESAHWSIASTGVIDTVPLAASDEATDDESAPEETPAEEAASADGESDADGQSGSDEHHDGDEHEGGENHHG
ncbi:ATP-binding cassette domain-containing protein [Microbacterium maritypicum]|uniref:ATP-binding cassette domain-containing protein n=1 Tax=Microbacterium maritypicum TaxID=33918 RepID=UPI003558A801